MKLNQNNVKYMFLNSGSNKIIPLLFLCLRYTLYVPQGYQYKFWTDFENA